MSSEALAIEDPRIAGAHRPAPPTALAATLTFARRSALKTRHAPEQLGDVIFIPILFTVMFTYLFGGALARSTGAYLQFLLPGTLAMTVLQVTMYTGVALNADINTGAFDRFRSLPIWRPAPLLGAVLGDTVRYVVASALVVGLGLIMGYRPAGGVLGVSAAIALVLAFAFGVSWVWTSLALLLRTPQAVGSIGLVVMFPLTFASNVFVAPGTMPSLLRAFVEVNPVSHLVTAVRSLMAGTPDRPEIVIALALSAALIAVFGPATAYLYRRKS